MFHAWTVAVWGGVLQRKTVSPIQWNLCRWWAQMLINTSIVSITYLIFARIESAIFSYYPFISVVNISTGPCEDLRWFILIIIWLIWTPAFVIVGICNCDSSASFSDLSLEVANFPYSWSCVAQEVARTSTKCEVTSRDVKLKQRFSIFYSGNTLVKYLTLVTHFKFN